MNSSLTLFTAAMVALIGVGGQFLISNRKYIPNIREERAKAYTNFLSACLIGMRAADLEPEFEVPIGTPLPDDVIARRDWMRNHYFESLVAYDQEINQSLAYMQIIAPDGFANLGKNLMYSIYKFNVKEISREEMEQHYSIFAERARSDLRSLQEQSFNWKTLFKFKIREIPFNPSQENQGVETTKTEI